MKGSIKPLIDFIFVGTETSVDMSCVPEVSDEQLENYFQSATIKCIE